MIMSGCAAFAQVVGPTRIEAELLPQWWEQVKIMDDAASSFPGKKEREDPGNHSSKYAFSITSPMVFCWFLKRIKLLLHKLLYGSQVRHIGRELSSFTRHRFLSIPNLGAPINEYLNFVFLDWSQVRGKKASCRRSLWRISAVFTGVYRRDVLWDFVQLVIAKLLPTQVSITRCDVKLLNGAVVNLVKTKFTHFVVGKSYLYQS